MFKSDYKFSQPQQEIKLTLKSFKELWIYGLVVKLIRVKRKPVITSKDVTSFASIFNMISMFANSSQSRSSSHCKTPLERRFPASPVFGYVSPD